MAEEKINNSLDQEKEAISILVDELTLFDDDLMSRVFDKNIEATELVLRIILGRNIKVISVDGQDEMRNHDKFRKGLPLYHIDRYVRETNELFDDGSHIIYVNGNYKGNDEIGQLMKDFHQTAPENMYYDALARGVKHFKETEEGREQMCEAVEKYAKEYAIREKIVSVKNLMSSQNIIFLDIPTLKCTLSGLSEHLFPEILSSAFRCREHL